ncbi:MAG TPA: ribosome small subunit-dependent GTPase A [Candidatus Moranbacteria bacterium]|mgnify:CR=1 FL=1|nr:ribosome small subunit-dependent GTPase A [Candidatus Moranbacteria bacterium]
MNTELKIEDLGWDDFFVANQKKLGLDSFKVARVIAQHKGAYKIKNADGEFLAKITGKQMFSATSREDYPAVGDWVVITEADKEQAVIKSILPRKTVMKRKYGDKNKIGEKNETQIIAANIDVAFVIESVDRDYNLNRIERYFAIANDGNIKPAVILNKTDLIGEEELKTKIDEIKNRLADADVIATSTLTNEGLSELENYITKGKTYCFLGSSGVGKSSLINKLLGEEIIKTKDIGAASGRGRHTTTGREMYFLSDGGIVIDNPGVREVGMTDAGAGVDNLFDEITALAKNCKFVDCTHTQEPGCKVLEALESGQLDRNRYANYISLKKETEYFEMSDFEKKEKDRRFGKFVKTMKKGLRETGHKDF